MNLFNLTIHRKNTTQRPAVWMMRQAGRYHSHYQKLKEKHSFMELCKIPELACETTMGPIRDFDFDAAILFSDLLFPLEVLGTGLRYDPGPKLDWHLREVADLKKLNSGGVKLAEQLQFQADAMKLIRKELPASKGLLGFVGGPATLFAYAVEGSHSGELVSTKAGLRDGRFEGFNELLLDLLAENMALQARAGADTIVVMDTCAGELDVETYRKYVVPSLRVLFEKFVALCPDTPISYYSKKTGPAHWEALKGLPIACKGIDWNHEIADVLSGWSAQWAIQGNIDPNWLFLDSAELESRLRAVFMRVKALPRELRKGWVCGLGHGILPKTPESNVRLFVRLEREIFGQE
ncbi:uroporphyrinogen decarboxylase family protein [Bdellovibrionota bacterium FG-1]